MTNSTDSSTNPQDLVPASSAATSHTLRGGGLVRFSLKYPRTWIVAAIAIVFLGVSAVIKIPADIFPYIDIPVVTVVWTYTGLSPQEVEQRITTFSEFQISNTVNDIKNIESQSLPGVSVERI